MKNIKNKIKNKKLIIFGEIHGTKEIPNKISAFFSDYAKEEDFNVCLEIPKEFQGNIEDFFKEPNLDGRNSLEYLNLIKNLQKLRIVYNREIKIFCVDPNKDTQKENEEGLANNILKILDDKKTFAILGDVHASKKPVSFGKQNIVTAGSIIFNKLKDKMFSVRLAPTKGKFYNFGVKEIIENNLEESFNNNFDEVIDVGMVSVCSFL